MTSSALRAALVAGGALAARRALRSRIQRSPLWPLPALATPVSGYSPRRVLRARLTARTEIAEDVVELRFTSAELPSWEPGAHVDLILPSGLVRQYSLCGDPAAAGSYTIAPRLVHGGRGGSREAHQALQVGATVSLRVPRNRFPIRPARSHLFIAGGIGITPVLPMVRQLAAEGADWRLLYCGRSRDSMPFLAELAAHGDRVEVHAGQEQGRRLDLRRLWELPKGTEVYCCGPTALMAAVADALPEGTPLHLERFAPTVPAGPAKPFTLELARTGRTLTVPANSSTLAAVRSALPGTPYSCEQGFCGTCQTKVVRGGVDHRDELLTETEREDSMLICVSRARGERLTLDL
ncbi:PDR/VanB family oxidoreductase [Streptomyces sp. NPDC006879]|uniref:PDR/VanB family oxidoreductase n=1 Tax=Streptomyces sp. NPDC006879 TaxID=3364767 RepID=UPI00367F63E6